MKSPVAAPLLVRWYLNLTGYDGITLPPFGIYIREKCLSDDRLCRHEQMHWIQYMRMGAIKFYAVYLWQLFRYGYEKHPMEIEARSAE